MSERLLDSDFVMIEIMTPTGEPALISQTSFLASSDETKGLNFWSPNPNITQTQIETGGEIKTTKRIISEHILAVLGAHPDKTYALNDVVAMLESAGHKHTRGMVKDNLDLLVAAGNLMKDKECFGVQTSPVKAVA